MIGIIGAMESETKKILQDMKNVKENKIGPFTYYVGTLFDKKICISTSLEGKVNSAICTQLMISFFDIKYIINIGVAGGLDERLDIGGIAISTNTVEFDQDTTALGYDLGYTFGAEKVLLKCGDFSSCIYDIAKKDENVVLGTIASSDRFVVDDKTKKFLMDNFNAIAVDMETASINHVCFLNGVEFCAIRAISDNGSKMEFREFVEVAMGKMNKIIYKYIESI